MFLDGVLSLSVKRLSRSSSEWPISSFLRELALPMSLNCYSSSCWSEARFLEVARALASARKTSIERGAEVGLD
jgi:hypothetical protein